MKYTLGFLNLVASILVVLILIKIYQGWQPFRNTIQNNITGIYEACRIEGGMTKVDRDTMGRRIIICTVPLE